MDMVEESLFKAYLANFSFPTQKSARRSQQRAQIDIKRVFHCIYFGILVSIISKTHLNNIAHNASVEWNSQNFSGLYMAID